MRTVRWIAGWVVALATLGAGAAAAADPATGPSFDCAQAHGVLEAAICTDPTVAGEDRLTAQLFALVRTDALGAGPSAELAAQRKWLADRDKECAAKAPTEITACLRQKYDARLAELAVAALIRAPDPALAELRRQDPAQAPLYEAIWRMATMPDGAASTTAVSALIAPEFAKVQAAQASMLDPIKTPQQAASSLKNFATFIDLSGAVDDTPVTISCEAIVRQPALIGALDSMFGSSMDNSLGGSDCDDMLPPPPHFGDLAADALDTATSDPGCTGTLRYAGMRQYEESLIAVQLNREGARARPDADVARKSLAYQRGHAAQMAAAESDLAAYYTAELHLANAAALAKTAVAGVVDGAFDVCDDE